MSRFSFTNEKDAELVTGYDHVTGVFIQIYSPVFLGKEAPMVNINNQGIWMDPLAGALISATQKQGLQKLEKRFISARKSGIPYPNLDMDAILTIAELFGFSDQKEQIRYDMS